MTSIVSEKYTSCWFPYAAAPSIFDTAWVPYIPPFVPYTGVSVPFVTEPPLGKAYELARLLTEKKLVKIDTAKEFTDLVEEIKNIL